MKENEFEIADFQLVKELGNEKGKVTNYGISVNNVREIIQLPELTEYPKGGEYVVGVFTSRDKVTPLIHLSKWLGLSSTVNGRFVIVIESDNGSTYGFLIDTINRIHRISMNDIEKSDGVPTSEDNDGVIGTIKLEDRLLFILDFEQIMSDIKLPLNG